MNTDDFRHTMNTYDKTISDYYRERTNGQREETWSDQILNFMKQKPRTYLNDYVKEKGFNKTKANLSVWRGFYVSRVTYSDK